MNRYEVTRSQREILKALRVLKQQRIPLFVEVLPNRRVYTTYLYYIDSDNQYLHFERFASSSTDDLSIETNSQVIVKAFMHPVSVEFSVQFIDRIAHGESMGYRLTLPTELERSQQQRAAYRITIPEGISIPVKINLQDGMVVEGEMMDISVSGTKIRVPEKYNDLFLEISDPVCEVQLNGQQVTLRSEIEIRRQYLQKRKGDTPGLVIGIAFLKLSKEQLQQLNRFIIDLLLKQGEILSSVAQNMGISMDALKKYVKSRKLM